MKAICYTRADGGFSICRPVEGQRLAIAISDADGNEIARRESPVPVDQFFRRWPVEGVTAEWAETEDEFVDRVRSLSVPTSAADVLLVDESEIPADRTFRDALRHDGKKLSHDISKAQSIQMDRIREAREIELVALDKDWNRAAGRKKQAEADAIEAKREALRNLPATFDLSKATTLEELAALWPPELAGHVRS